MTSGGYVGLSIATLLSQHHKVTAVDIIPEKVELINNKKSPIQDEYIEKYLAEKELNLTATLDAKEAYSAQDCCGCTACYAICPKDAITMIEDEEGFGTEKLDVKTIVKTAAPAYIPTAISMVASAGCMIGAMNENDRRNAALAAASRICSRILLRASETLCPTWWKALAMYSRKSGK